MPRKAAAQPAKKSAANVARQPAGDVLVFTCEHAGHAVPDEFAAAFADHAAALATHRGYDVGALELARAFAAAYPDAPLHVGTYTRLLVDLNRSPHNPRGLFTAISREFSPADKQRILENYYWPYRCAVTAEIAGKIAAGHRVIHVLVHSFTPVLDGKVRTADVSLLYDPQRPAERPLADRWLAAIAAANPALRLRRNYPYTGTADGFEVALRREFGPSQYIGLTLEINQAFPLGRSPGWPQLQASIVAALQTALLPAP